MRSKSTREQRRWRIYLRVISCFCLALLLLLAAFQSIWVFGGSASGIMLQVGLQRTRVENIAKNVQILENQPAATHPQAVSELQSALPRFEKTQAGLQNGDDSLQLPMSVPTDIAPLVANTQPDYNAIDGALRQILAHIRQPIDPTEVAIILEHEHGYALAINQVNVAWKQRIDSAFLHIFWIESVLVAANSIVAIIVYFYVSRGIIAKIPPQEAAPDAS
jgi:hypothetical protein